MSEYSERQLSAYFDGELDDDQMRKIGLWLASADEAQLMLKDYQWQREQLHMTYDSVMSEPVPKYLLAGEDGKLSFHLGKVAAVLLVFFLGFSSAWQLKPSQIDFSSTEAKVQGATNAHALYAAERLHPVEVGAEVEHLMPWLSARIGRDLSAPTFREQGYEFLGGRLMTEGGIAAALLMYQDDKGQRISLYISNSGYNSAAALYKTAQLNSFIWQNQHSTFILVGEIEAKILKGLAKLTNQQIQRF